MGAEAVGEFAFWTEAVRGSGGAVWEGGGGGAGAGGVLEQLGCGVDDVTLSRLEAAVPPTRRIELTDRKKLLRSLARELRSEHVKTMMLLSACARFNSSLLRGILELGRTGVITYASDGAARSQSDTAFVNLQF